MVSDVKAHIVLQLLSLESLTEIWRLAAVRLQSEHRGDAQTESRARMRRADTTRERLLRNKYHPERILPPNKFGLFQTRKNRK